ncbi:MAG: replication initiator protein A [Isosphaeraceae bacterium]
MDDWGGPEDAIRDHEEGIELLKGPDDVGKDELNLAEFPIAALTDRIPDGQTTLVFEDRLEQREGPPIIRRLTITGTAKHGLPTSLDDEVLVGLIQLTKRRNGFSEPRVSFSRYELIEILGWPQDGRSYRRIEEALHRWVGVVLIYENAWWDNEVKSWVDEDFHVLDNVSLYDRERRAKVAKIKKGGKLPPPLSSFRWNEVIFRSFQSGNLKQLDLELYLRLRLPTTKRLYRFLDKRFYRRDRLEFDLRSLACEHIGMSRTYAPTELKRRLRPALEELEAVGFLEPLKDSDRYAQVKRGCWRILLIRGPRGGGPCQAEEPAHWVAALVDRGIAAKTAAELVEGVDGDYLRTKIEVYDWLIRNGDKRVARNPAGVRVASIREDYQPPAGYSAGADPKAQARAQDPPADPAAERRKKAQARREAQAAAARQAELKAKWDALPQAERDAILAEVKAENPGLVRWKAMLEPLCLARLDARLNPGRRSQKTLFGDDA